ncbi:MAG: APC family permease [Candidatus Acidiferrum sp.]
MKLSPPTKLVRVIGRWSLSALMINAIVGSGIFGLPAIVTQMLGKFGPCAYLLAALGIGLVAACFAEVSSQFSEAGGPYLYARVAYGQFAGIQVAWLAWLVRLTSGAANANIFVQYFGGFMPAAQSRLLRAAVLLFLIGGLAAINIIGAKAGATLSNFLAAAKLLPLVVFVVAGLLLLRHESGGSAPIAMAAAPELKQWLSTVLLIIFALSGFEAALIPMGEARDARHDAPFAIFLSLIICAGIYTLIQVVVLRALGLSPSGDRPLAQAAQVFLGRGGAVLMQVGALISVYGNLSAMMLNVPRLTYALAERGDFPSIFGVVSRKFRTPYVSIVAFAAGMFLLALSGPFQGNAVLSAVARLVTYAVVCACVITLRRQRPNANAFRLPAGTLIAALALVFVLALISRMGLKELIAIAGVMAVALLNWAWAKRKTLHI